VNLVQGHLSKEMGTIQQNYESFHRNTYYQHFHQACSFVSTGVPGYLTIWSSREILLIQPLKEQKVYNVVTEHDMGMAYVCLECLNTQNWSTESCELFDYSLLY
jgi:hypothetical protein